MERPRPSPTLRRLLAVDSALLRGRYLILVLLPFICLGRGLIPGRVLSPADLLARLPPWSAMAQGPGTANDHVVDVAFQIQPWLILARDEVRHGRWPLWNPFTYAGAPLLASIGSAVLSPFTLLAYLLPATTAVSLGPPLKLAIAGCGMCWFLDLLGASAVASFLGAVTFMFSGFMMAWLAWPVAGVACWLPWLCAMVERLRIGGRWRTAGWLSAVFAVQFFGGQPETSEHVALLVVAWAVWRAPGRGSRRFLIQFGSAAALGIALATIQWLPFLAYARECLSWQRRFVPWSGPHPGYAPRAMLSLLMPDWFGNHARGLPWTPDRDITGNFVEMSGFVGLAPVVLLFAALPLARRSTHLPFLLTALAGSLALVYRVVPLEWLLRPLPAALYLSAIRLLLIADFAAAGVTALTLDALLRSPATPRRRAASMIAGGVIALCLMGGVLAPGQPAWRHIQLLWFVAGLLAAAGCALTLAFRAQRGRTAAWALLCLQAFPLMHLTADFHGTMPTNAWYPTPTVLRALMAEPRPMRVRLPAVNVGVIWGLEDPGGYDAMNPGRMSLLLTGTTAGGPLGNDPVWVRAGWSAPRLNLLNVRFWVTPPGAAAPMPDWRPWYRGTDATVYRNPSALPRALLVHRTIACGSAGEALAQIDAPGTDLRHEALLERAVAVLDRGSPNEADPTFVKYEPQHIELLASPRSAALLILLDRWDAGWRALVDGRRERIERVDFDFRGVRLEAGRHRIEFVYVPMPFRLGLWVTLLAAGVLGALWLPEPLRRSSRKK